MYVVVAVLFSAGDHVPAIPFKEEVGKVVNCSPEQIGATGLNVGATIGFTVIINVAFEAHCPATGVNVYVVVCELSNAGDHVPVIPFTDVVGNAVNASPAQIAETDANVGVVNGSTAITKVVVVAHCPAVGVNVYVVVAELFNAGDHVPVIPFVDVVGNGANVDPIQIAATGANVGTSFGFTVIVVVAVVAH